jgi:hypothetical protein
MYAVDLLLLSSTEMKMIGKKICKIAAYMHFTLAKSCFMRIGKGFREIWDDALSTLSLFKVIISTNIAYLLVVRRL